MSVETNIPPASQSEKFLATRKVKERYGVDTITLDRWSNDPRVGFPKPLYFGRNRYWDIDQLRAFEQRARKQVA